MKKYHIADFLTCSEFIITIIMIVQIIIGTSVDIVIWMLVSAELCDAFDGICARKWLYPKDGKYRWWREYAPQIDQITDVFLALVGGFYIILCIDITRGILLLVPTSLFCLVVQIITKTNKARDWTRLILVRRYIYVLAIACAIVIMIFATSWPTWLKEAVLCVGVAAGIVLVIAKRDRLTQDKTPLSSEDRL